MTVPPGLDAATLRWCAADLRGRVATLAVLGGLARPEDLAAMRDLDRAAQRFQAAAEAIERRPLLVPGAAPHVPPEPGPRCAHCGEPPVGCPGCECGGSAGA